MPCGSEPGVRNTCSSATGGGKTEDGDEDADAYDGTDLLEHRDDRAACRGVLRWQSVVHW